ncbi:hypothetical protein [Haloarcula salinisoli]|uniref:Uncharacterized protein n=1 Tax=Haloarcula salinisoli TaxID=2487746 RepID=A0A8J7YB57_9EURY|nr:hypothetical protein [Halomicroarcula salinisoli]MBX0285692.1 hypothetical protein [Halomicroarcula salinisoli]MBX0302820.1 hypothetical protein [Halomicroarcula salinisoli]
MDLPLPLLDVAERTLITLGLVAGAGSLLLWAVGGVSPVMVPVGVLLLLQSVHYLRERTATEHGLSD